MIVTNVNATDIIPFLSQYVKVKQMLMTAVDSYIPMVSALSSSRTSASIFPITAIKLFFIVTVLEL